MNNFLIRPSSTIRGALSAMSSGGTKCLIVVDNEKRVIGTLSDGDIRRALLHGSGLEETINKVYFSEPAVLESGGYSENDARGLFSKHHFELIPIVDGGGKVVGVLTWDQFIEFSQEKFEEVDIPVVIMAGGRGTRLEPFTKVFPKPLLPIKEKPVIEHIIDRFVKAGVTEFYLTVNYKSSLLKAYFEELNPPYSVKLIEEEQPLGTAGGLTYLSNMFDREFVVTNCDILVEMDIARFISFHRTRKNIMSVVACHKNHTIPYGHCHIDEDGNLVTIEEKPEYKLLVNTGLYVLSPDVFDVIPKDRSYHMTELIEDVKKMNLNVGVFPISEEQWIDVGQWPEYEKAIKLFSG